MEKINNRNQCDVLQEYLGETKLETKSPKNFDCKMNMIGDRIFINIDLITNCLDLHKMYHIGIHKVKGGGVDQRELEKNNTRTNRNQQNVERSKTADYK